MARPTTLPGSRTATRAFVPAPEPKTPKSARTRQLLLGVAASLFTEQGYSAVSIQDIATAANLTKGAVYGHFRSKGQLLVEVIRWKLAELEETPEFRKAIADPEHAVELLFHEAGRETRLLEVDAAAAARHDPDVAAGLAAFYQERQDRIVEAAAGVADPYTSAWLIAALSAGIGMKESSGLPRPDASRLRATLLRALRGLN